MPKLTKHAETLLIERAILLEWVEQPIDTPERTETQPDATIHSLRRIAAFGNRWLRVVQTADSLVVTVFFDRRVR